MQSVAWDDDELAGIAMVDRYHQHLKEQVDELLGACFASQGPEVVARIIERMINSTPGHFAEEEAMLAQAGYERIVEHKRAHREFSESLKDLQTRLREGASHEISNDALLLLSRWLKGHVEVERRELESFLMAKRVA
ncbi:MAG: hemerythrin family protein [Rhodospirillales bacterium]|nr:hemerythrin family protein [Rhodospirillales bacterium]MCW8862343.1 hemerythrin family protein [Rhodospirillales bacterium]MCW8951653.1 hemerythrin family protein [Rhodospirillales bacterium]MCW8970768.1 hemerythrin family protein [Rhodospirillales bacterium]MCW9002298.1 hemerythrin family protein [Rhodospirillales bacterium]